MCFIVFGYQQSSLCWFHSQILFDINSPWKYFSRYTNGSNVLIALGSTLVFSVASFPTAYAMTILIEHPFFQIFEPGTEFWVEVEVGGLGQVFF